VLAAVAEALAGALFARALPPDQAGLLPHAGTLGLAAAVLCLRQTEGPAAGDQFMVMETRTRRLPALPRWVAGLEGVAGLEAAVAAVTRLTQPANAF
jgi:hypothetical protein